MIENAAFKEGVYKDAEEFIDAMLAEHGEEIEEIIRKLMAEQGLVDEVDAPAVNGDGINAEPAGDEGEESTKENGMEGIEQEEDDKAEEGVKHDDAVQLGINGNGIKEEHIVTEEQVVNEERMNDWHTEEVIGSP